VARVESRTFICRERAEDAGPLNNHQPPAEMRAALDKQLRGAMRGRTMYVAPFCMGPLGSPLSALGVQVTDSKYVVANMYIMTRMGKGVLKALGRDAFFVPATHSSGAPLAPGEQDAAWPCSTDKTIAHFPEAKEIVSVGSGYGGNAILPKKCYALRIASVLAREQGWLAEHMALMKVTPPPGSGRKPSYVAAAFPSACGKTNFAMMLPTMPGWKVEVLGDDISWLRIVNGRLRAINPENGFFGVAPGTGPATNAMALASCARDTLFTNVAIDPTTQDVWWPGIDAAGQLPPPHLVTWLRRDWFASAPHTGSVDDTVHANSRFTAPAANCPSLADEWQSPEGVPVDAIIFGGRRSETVPLVAQSRSWAHGVLQGATLSSEQTAAAEGKRGDVRFDPMAMRPFIGYDAASYLQHWLDVGAKAEAAGVKMPKIFHVNWFRRGPAGPGGKKGAFLWPGFGENLRVVDWVIKRCAEPAAASDIAVESPVGFLPARGALDLSGLEPAATRAVSEITAVDAAASLGEAKRSGDFLRTLGPRLPAALAREQADLVARLEAAAAARR
jgi:phosphoenolpyruvate carboxykinase (GTP)